MPDIQEADLAWSLVLQHHSTSTQLQLVSKLLCVSRNMAVAVREHCAGQLLLCPPHLPHTMLDNQWRSASDTAALQQQLKVLAGQAYQLGQDHRRHFGRRFMHRRSRPSVPGDGSP